MLFAALLIHSIVEAQLPANQSHHFNSKEGVALSGYDPVSYYDGKPVEGSADLKVINRGVTYLFSSSPNLQKFKTNPDKYQPAYGGWCAYAMGASGEKVKVDPETYSIIDGRIYLFYNFWGNNTLEDWKENETSLRAAADKNWLKITR